MGTLTAADPCFSTAAVATHRAPAPLQQRSTRGGHIRCQPSSADLPNSRRQREDLPNLRWGFVRRLKREKPQHGKNGIDYYGQLRSALLGPNAERAGDHSDEFVRTRSI